MIRKITKNSGKPISKGIKYAARKHHEFKGTIKITIDRLCGLDSIFEPSGQDGLTLLGLCIHFFATLIFGFTSWD